MWHEKFTNKHGETKYRYYEKYKDPLTNKWRRVSVVLNKNGKQSQKEAQKRLNERIEEKLNNKTPTTLKTLTFHAACDEWFENYKLVSGAKQSTIRAKTYRLAHIKERINEDILVDKMNAQVIQDYINTSMKENNIKHITIKVNVSLIKSVLKFAQQRYNISDISYIDNVSLPKKAVTREELKAKRENYLEMNEVHKLIDELNHKASTSNKGYIKRSYMMTAYITEFQVLNGLRIGELLALQPENIDFKNKKIEIDGTIAWITKDGVRGFKDTTKTEASYRTISITTRSCEILRKVMLENKKSAKWDNNFKERNFIFTNSKGSPMPLSSINANIKNAAKNVGIEKDISTHTMRHSHISLLSQLGVSLRAIMDRVGHKDYKTTLQIYSHVTEQMDKDMMSKLEKVGI